MNSSSVDIADLLESESSLGLIFNTNLFIGKEPATPINCVTIFDTPGSAPQINLGGKSDSNVFFPSIQIRVRNSSYLDGYDLINRIQWFLHANINETVNSTLYQLIKCAQEPFLLDWDEKDRARFVCNFDITRKEV